MSKPVHALITFDTVTSTPPSHVRPTNPERIKNLKDPRDPSVQGSGDVTMKEGVTISSAGYGKVKVKRGGKVVKSFKDPRDAKMFVAKPKKTVKEEQLDEVSKEKLGRYLNKAGHIAFAHGVDYGDRADSMEKREKALNKGFLRSRSIARAGDKIGRAHV